MSLAKETPRWIEFIFQEICDEIEYYAYGEMHGRYLTPDDVENSRRNHFLEMFPVKLMSEFEIDMTGPRYGAVRRFDLLAAQKALTEVTQLSFGIDFDARPFIFMEGVFEGTKVDVLIYTTPAIEEQ